MSATTTTTDALELVEHLDSEAIRRQLDELEQRREALRVLWRAARARERVQPDRREPRPAGR